MRRATVLIVTLTTLTAATARAEPAYCALFAAYLAKKGVPLPEAGQARSLGPRHCHSVVTITGEHIIPEFDDKRPIPLADGNTRRARRQLERYFSQRESHWHRMERLLPGRSVREPLGVAADRDTPYALIQAVFAAARPLRPGLCLLTDSLRCIPIANEDVSAFPMVLGVSKQGFYLARDAVMLRNPQGGLPTVPRRSAQDPEALARLRVLLQGGPGPLAVGATPDTPVQQVARVLAVARAAGRKTIYLVPGPR